MEIEHKTLFTKYLEYVASHFKFPLDQELINKRPHITSTAIVEFFDVTITHLQRIMVHRRVPKGFPHLGSYLLKKFY